MCIVYCDFYMQYGYILHKTFFLNYFSFEKKNCIPVESNKKTLLKPKANQNRDHYDTVPKHCYRFNNL